MDDVLKIRKNGLKEVVHWDDRISILWGKRRPRIVRWNMRSNLYVKSRNKMRRRKIGYSSSLRMQRGKLNRNWSGRARERQRERERERRASIFLWAFYKKYLCHKNVRLFEFDLITSKLPKFENLNWYNISRTNMFDRKLFEDKALTFRSPF